MEILSSFLHAAKNYWVVAKEKKQTFSGASEKEKFVLLSRDLEIEWESYPKIGSEDEKASHILSSWKQKTTHLLAKFMKCKMITAE